MRFLLLSVCLFAASASAADLSAAKSLYGACAACHGAQGEGNPGLKAPNIGGMDLNYVERQLQLFRKAGRGSADASALAMQGAANALKSEADISAVAHYVASLPVVAVNANIKGDLTNGRNYYNGLCSACHDSSGKGNSSLSAPRLAGIDASYLQRQFAAFKSGTRGTHVDDKLGKQMSKMAKVLPDAKTENDVFAYIATLKL